MAAPMVITPAQADIISSLSTDDIPAKLRCAICSKLAVNAFRLPCCEQAICESCHSKLPSSCPICEHSPLSADDCTPHKSLRTTVRVFLRTEEKKREASRPKASAPATSVEPTPIPQLPAPDKRRLIADAAHDAGDQHATPAAQPVSADTALPSTEGQGDVQGASGAQPDASVQNDNRPKEDTPDAENTQQPVKEEGTEPADAENKEESADAEVKNQEGEDQQDQTVSTAGPGFNAMNGAFPNMNFGAAGNMDQMQTMMAMQNGMPAGAFGGFPMMGMAGMGMDPMAMQQMYMNGGFGAQGMGAMSGMMGMGGFGAAAAAVGGPNNNWNNGQQQSWNVGQDNFNHPSASGMGHGGDYGSFNSGFPSTGYNQGNYGHANQFNNYRQNQYGGGGAGFRGRGRGRGYGYGYGYGYNNARGGGGGGGGYYQNQGGYGGQGNFQDQQNYMGQNYQQGQMHDQGYNHDGAGVPEGGENTDQVKNGAPAVDEFGREIRGDEAAQGAEGEGAEQTDQTNASQPNGDGIGTCTHPSSSDDPSHVAPQTGGDPAIEGNGAFPGTTGYGPMSAGPGSNRAFSQPPGSRSGSIQPTPTPASDVPLNAPKGPKALLRGLPNTSYLALQARGLVPDDKASRNQNQPYLIGDYPNTAMNDGRSRSGSRVPERDHSTRRDDSGRRHRRDHRDREYDDSHRDYNDDRDRARSLSPSRSRSRGDRRDSRRHRRDDRSQSATVRDEGRGGEEDSRSSRRHRHKESSHRHPDDVVVERAKGVADVVDEQHRSRSVSPADDTKRSSHHRSSRRDRDSGEKRSSRDKDYDRDRDRKHRSHRDRDRDYDRRDREKDRHRDRDGGDKDKDKDRDRKERRRDRERDRDSRDHRHRGSKRTSAEPEEVSAPSFNPPSGPRAAAGQPQPEKTRGGGLEIKGRSSASTTAQEAGVGQHQQLQERRRSSVATAAAEKDPYAAERDKANRERLLKEARQMAQRVAAQRGGRRIEEQTSGGSKRRRGEDAVAAGPDNGGERRSSHRRKGRRGEVVDVDDDEERMRRLEAEREGARFRGD